MWTSWIWLAYSAKSIHFVRAHSGVISIIVGGFCESKAHSTQERPFNKYLDGWIIMLTFTGWNSSGNHSTHAPACGFGQNIPQIEWFGLRDTWLADIVTLVWCGSSYSTSTISHFSHNWLRPCCQWHWPNVPFESKRSFVFLVVFYSYYIKHRYEF